MAEQNAGTERVNTQSTWLLKLARLNQSDTLFCIIPWLFEKAVLFVDDFLSSLYIETCFDILILSSPQHCRSVI